MSGLENDSQVAQLSYERAEKFKNCVNNDRWREERDFKALEIKKALEEATKKKQEDADAEWRRNG
jgi:hypothetical protein